MLQQPRVSSKAQLEPVSTMDMWQHCSHISVHSKAFNCTQMRAATGDEKVFWFV